MSRTSRDDEYAAWNDFMLALPTARLAERAWHLTIRLHTRATCGGPAAATAAARSLALARRLHRRLDTDTPYPEGQF